MAEVVLNGAAYPRPDRQARSRKRDAAYADGRAGTRPGGRKKREGASLETRDLARARKKVVALDSGDETPHKPVNEAVTAFLEHCKSESLTDATITKYRNALGKLAALCTAEEIDTLDEIATEVLDRFRAGRGLAPITAAQELEILRVFFRLLRGSRLDKGQPGQENQVAAQPQAQ